MNWEEFSVNVGNIPAGSEKVVIFKSKGPLEIRSIEPSCGCIRNLGYNKETRELRISYYASQIPFHLRGQGGYEIMYKEISVIYKDGSSDTLSIKGRVVVK